MSFSGGYLALITPLSLVQRGGWVVRLLVAGFLKIHPPGQWLAQDSAWKTFVTSVSQCRAAGYLQM